MALQIDSTITLASGAQLPRLGLGVYQARSSECVDAVKTAIGAGYRHIDTAQGYRNEDYPPNRPTWYAATTLHAGALTKAVVGRGIACTSLPRSSLYITTKYMPSHTPQSAFAVYTQLCKSLKPLHRGPLIPSTREGKAELKRRIAAGEAEEPPREKEEVEPYIDLFLVHAPWGGQEGREANWAALRRAKEEGWVRDIGVSNFGIKHLESLPGPKPAVNQIELHPWCQQKPIVAYCQANGIALQAYCPLVRADEKRWQDPVLQEICKKVGKGEAQVLVRWSLQKGFAALPKSVSPDRIRSNTDVYNFELDKEDMAKLDSLDEGANGACSWNPVEAD